MPVLYPGLLTPHHVPPLTLAGIRGNEELQLNEHTLSMRLERVAAHMPAGARLADIGSDHGYLPVALMRRGAIASAVAGEVALTPFNAARRTVRDNELEQRISVRQANGLEAIEAADGITAISICGMGVKPFATSLTVARLV